MSGSALDGLLGRVASGGVALELGAGLNFKGGLKATQNPATGLIDVDTTAAADRALPGIAYVDPSYTGASIGTAGAPYPTCAAALAATSGDVCLMLAPGTYDEVAFTVPSARKVHFKAVAGSLNSISQTYPVTFTNTITWSARNGDQLRLTCLKCSLALSDGDSGTSDVYVFAESCRIGSIVNGNPAAAAYTHKFNLSLAGKNLTPDVPGQSPEADMSCGAVAIRGVLHASCASIFTTAGVTNAALRNCAVGGSGSWSGDSTAVGTYFTPGITITQPGGVHLYADRLSKFYLTSITHSGGTGSIDLLD